MKNLPKIKIEISKKIFCFYAILNLLGYKAKNYPPHPARKKILECLNKQIDKESLKKIQEIISSVKYVEFWYPFRTWILCHGQPPRFKEMDNYWKKIMPSKIGYDFEKEIKKIWKEDNFSDCWKLTEKEYKKTKEQLSKNTKIHIKNCLDYLKIKNTAKIKEIIIIPNFLEEYNRGIGPRIKNRSYIILGPSLGKNSFPEQRIQHELLHSIINHIIYELFSKELSAKEISLMREIIIHGIVLRINKRNKKYYQKKIALLEKKGFKNIKKVLSFLENCYEISNQNFRKFISNNKNSIKNMLKIV